MRASSPAHGALSTAAATRARATRSRTAAATLGMVLSLVAAMAGPVAAEHRGGGSATHEAAWASFNWAGYVVTNGPVASVSGSWLVPVVAPTSRPTFSALWLGVDGVDARGLIQVGTEQDYYGGRAHYGVWWEVLPAPAVPIRSFGVHPGDTISASVTRVAPGRWRITISDSRGGRFTTIRAYDGPGSSAEWIEEAPVVDSRLAPLAHTSLTRFDHAKVNGTAPGLTGGDSVALARGFSIVLTPSEPDADGDGFTLRVGASVPPAPRS